MKAKPAKPTRCDVIPAEPHLGPVLWFEFDKVDARLLAQGIVSTRVQEMAAASVAWMDDDPSGFVDRTDEKRMKC